jgi:hypothetical protein
MLAKFTSKLEKSPNKGGWTYATWSETAKVFGTHGAVKVRGTVDGHPIETSFMAMGDGVQMLPIKSDIRKAINKEAGDTVEIIITERIE